MKKPLNRIWSGVYAESHVFQQLSLRGYTPKMARKNQKGYDIEIPVNERLCRKIEVKHIQRTGSSSRDSFKLKAGQAQPNSFDILVLLVSDCTRGSIRNHDYYIFTWAEINKIVSSKKKSQEYTFNLSDCGQNLASVLLNPYSSAWSKI